MPDPAGAPTARKTRVFISYARADMAFADALVSALEQHDIEVLIDRRDLPYGEEWKPELLGFVHQSDAVVFIVSPHSIASRWCRWEVEQVKAESKRLVPIVLYTVPIEDLPPEIAAINLLPFEGTWNAALGARDSLSSQAEMLVKVLLANRAWTKEHSHLGELARRWHAAVASAGPGRGEVLLLRGDALSDAELWISRQPREAPEPSELQRTFIQESRKAEQARAERERKQLQKHERELNQREQRISQRTQQLVGIESARALEAQRYAGAMRIALAGEPSERDLANGLLPDPARRAQLASAAHHALCLGCFPVVLPGLRAIEDEVFAAIFSPDCNRLLTAGGNALQLWDIGSGTELSRFEHRNYVRRASFSADGKWLLAVCHNTAHVWNVADAVQSATLNHDTELDGAFFLPSHEHVVTAFADTAQLWDCRGRLIRSRTWRGTFEGELPGFSKAELEAAINIGLAECQAQRRHHSFSTDGLSVIAECLRDGVELRHAITGNQFNFVQCEHPLRVALSSDAQRVAAASMGGRVAIWDATNGTELTRVDHRGDIDVGAELGQGNATVAFSPDGTRLITTSLDGAARIWDAGSGAELLRLRHDGWVTGASFSPNGKLILTEAAGHVRVWDAVPSRELVHFCHGTLKYDWSSRAVFSRDASRVATVSDDNIARVWDAYSGSQLALLEHDETPGWPLFSDDNARLVSRSSKVYMFGTLQPAR